jgi:hypothetical protein
MPSEYYKKPKQLIAGIDRNTFNSWFNTANAGESCEYYTATSLGQADDPTVELARELRELFSEGRLELCQRKLPGRGYAYLAVKRREVRPPKVFGGRWLPHVRSINDLVYAK